MMNTYKRGLILITLAWVASLNIYWIIFAGPAFIIGILIVWFSNEKLKTKLLTTILPLVLWYPGFLTLILFGSKHMSSETFLVPKNFRGKITLIYGEPCGQLIPKVNGRLVYKIPGSGVMILKNKFEIGIIDQEYYFVDKYWNKTEKIPLFIQQNYNEDYTIEKNKNEPPRNRVGLFLLGTGGGSTSKNENFKFHMMAVNSWDSLRVQEDGGRADKLSDSLLYKCRH